MKEPQGRQLRLPLRPEATTAIPEEIEETCRDLLVQLLMEVVEAERQAELGEEDVDE